MKKNNNVICWDSPCSLGKPICCLQCEAFIGCPEGCDQVEECDIGKEIAEDENEECGC